MISRNEKERLEDIFTHEGFDEINVQKLQRISGLLNIPLRKVQWFLLEQGIVPARYQYNIGCFGIDGQMKLIDSAVMIVGLGGLGGYVLENLARAGIGKMVGVDPDVFEESNLNRQLLADSESIGIKKIEHAKQRVGKVNPAVEFVGYASPFDKLEDEVFGEANLVFDCLDNVPDRRHLAKKCSLANVVLVHGAVAGWCGQVGVIRPAEKLFEKIYKNQTMGVEQDIGNLPFTVAVTASLMASEGIKVLLGKNRDKKQKVVFFDSLQQDWQTVYFE